MNHLVQGLAGYASNGLKWFQQLKRETNKGEGEGEGKREQEKGGGREMERERERVVGGLWRDGGGALPSIQSKEGLSAHFFFSLQILSEVNNKVINFT